jgi:murein DD-endopeptidase MepM/ murein hydrolase activator NlpD
MGTLVYSPDIEVLIESEVHGIINVSDDIVSGNMTLNQNRPHTLSIQLDNPRRKYDGAFLPNDRIVVRLKRLSFLQVFSGYLESVPFASVWPRAVSITASCSLKRLMYLLYDPGTQAMVDLLNEFVTTSDGTSDDGNLTERAKAVLMRVAGIREDNIHVGALPPEWWSTVSDLYAQVSPFFDASVVNLDTGTVPGTGAISGDFTPNADGYLTADQIVSLLYQAGWTTQEAVVRMGAIVYGESSFKVDVINPLTIRGSNAHGLFQIMLPLHEDTLDIRDRSRFLSDAAYQAQKAFQLWQIQGWGAWDADAPSTMRTNGQRIITEAISRTGFPPQTQDQAANQAMADRWAAAAAASSSTTQYDSGGDARLASMANDVASGGTTFPLPPEFQGTYNDNFGDDRSWNRSPDAADKTHDGIDINCPVGTPIFAIRDGTIIQANATLGNGAGRRITLVDGDGNHFKYFHLQTISVTEGQEVRAGQQMGTTGRSGASDTSYSPHLHIEMRPGGGEEQNIFPVLTGGAAPSGGTSGSTSSTSFLSAEFLTSQVQEESTVFAGIRRLMNDGGNNIHQLVSDLFGSSMRSYCSAPNGDIIAWFPDYFDNYGTAGKAVIEDIELIDFTINLSDTGMVTHQFVTGTYEGLHDEANPNDISLRYNSHGIASIDFPEILRALFGEDAGIWTDPEAIYKRFGARPNSEGISALIRDPGSGSSGEFFYAVHQFMFNWAALFSASVQVSFMPELWPGMLMQIPSQGLQVYVQQVTHSWNMQTGFTTSAQVIAPSGLDGSFMGLPQAQALAQARLY